MTRWHGVAASRHSRRMLPTARCARGEPASAAMSPYVATRPAGIRRTAARTRRANVDGAGTSAPDHHLGAEGRTPEIRLVESRADATWLLAETVRDRRPFGFTGNPQPRGDADLRPAEQVKAGVRVLEAFVRRRELVRFFVAIPADSTACIWADGVSTATKAISAGDLERSNRDGVGD